ncbi:MAG: hypothetical protein WCP61_03110 [Chitinophagia bacterium]|jgi:hypothetical protein
MMQKSAVVLLFFTLFYGAQLNAQTMTISGNVYDISGRRPIESVMVYSSANHAITDSLGRYLITVKLKDSLWFSLFGKNTQKYPIDTIDDVHNFNIMIHVTGFDLPEVRVRNSYYKLDSIQNRTDYAKYFNYQPPGLKLSNNQNLFGSGGLTIGFDLDEIINMFRVKRNRNLQFLQNRLLAQEQEKYVNYRFTKRFVQKLTHIEGAELDKFMAYCRPDYTFLGLLNDLELGLYIEKKYISFKKGL